jgi:hypothetical protein
MDDVVADLSEEERGLARRRRLWFVASMKR